ncbi:unnamed protein product [Caenorhabditis bovis]|uniref:V-type proton ATPase subunit a n=1 Tax=Caenorhabditis bovis TaxID=2654633 RepID=A0A8S1F6R1_9PELO|nr:unnamed protein product [Caenorhabditis bovis]
MSNSLSIGDSPLSFSNAVYLEHEQEEEEEEELDEEAPISEEFDFHYGTPTQPFRESLRKSFSKKVRRNFTIRPILASTPRVAYRMGASSALQCFSREPNFEPIPEFFEMTENINDMTSNSQGYRFMNNYALFTNNRRIQLDIIPKVTQLSRRFIGFIEDGVRNFRPTNSPEDGFEDEPLQIEFARDDREHINLSEIFSAAVTGRRKVGNQQQKPNGGSRFRNVRNERAKASNRAETCCCGLYEMGSLHRSEPMKLYQMILVKEAAYDCVAELGKHGNVQFVDLNSKQSMYTRTFVNQMRRCEEMERKLRFLEKQVITCDPELDPQSIDFSDLSAPSMSEIMQLELRLDQLEKEFVSLNENDIQLRRNLNSSKEYYDCMAAVDEFFQVHKDEDTRAKLEKSATAEELEMFSKSFSHGGLPSSNDIPLTPLLNQDDNAWFVAGVLPWDKTASFERVLWRACRRTAFVKTSDSYFTISDPVTLEPIQKCVFIVFFKGESLGQIVDKVCDGFNATQYPCPKTSKDRKMKMTEIEGRINDLTIVINTTQTHRYQILKELSFELPGMLKNIQIQKSVYHVMNMFTVDTNGFLAGECWIPAAEEANVKLALIAGFKKSGTEVEPILNNVHANVQPPTYHKTNKFTKVFQNIVDSYGVSQYREVNPAPYTIITFPFLFAIMFGDAAHGLILLLASLFFIFNERMIIKKKIRDEIFNTFFGGRYIMMLMGLFSIYTGFMYNDAFAKSANVFGSAWKNPYNSSSINGWINEAFRKKREILIELNPEQAFDAEHGPYYFGVDPIWNIAENRLVFLNSMKMKASIIIGIAQMTFGVFLSFLNHLHFNSYIDVLTNFIPQLIFLTCIFIYLCIQIVVKWVYFSVTPGNVLGYEYPGANCAPSLLIGLINMFMQKSRPEGYIDNDGHVHKNCHLGFWYPNQQFIEIVLLVVSILCVPIMLVGKPLWVHFVTAKRHVKKPNALASAVAPSAGATGELQKSNGAGSSQQEDAELLIPDEFDIDEQVHHSLSDIFVHQAIHTIEFVLGCVSHTASYLRLWALSLAHAQLSEVMWHMVLIQGLNISDGMPIYVKPIITAVTFAIFAILSLSILIMMEGLSAFLHALRLHWVEFQSKFYMGTGHHFHAFYLKEYLETAQLVTEETDRIADVSRGVH